MAGRIFNRRQALEREVKDIYTTVTVGAQVAATAVADLTNDITYTSVATGTARNTNTITIQVAAAAANPTSTILAAFTGTSAAITITITPNNGTNNGAVAVNMTTAQLAELINTGAVAGKTVTVTDASTLRALQTATGGGAQNLADAGEGDGVVATFANGGAANPTLSIDRGVSSIVRNGAGDYTITLHKNYFALKYMRATFYSSAATDARLQIHTESVATDAKVRFLIMAGTTPFDPINGSQMQLKLEVKNSGVI